jgi:exodeoxyribonuclease VII large subunit
MVIPSIRLSQLTQRVEKVLEQAFSNQQFWVVADVTNHSFKREREHHYFELVEKDPESNALLARIQAVAWRGGAEKIVEFERVTGQQFKNDIRVLVKVSVDYHAVYGLKLTVLEIDPNFTIGALEQQKQATLLRLLTECASFIRKSGDRYITDNNQLVMRPVIQTLAVVTSNHSAGYQDFMHTLENNSFGYWYQVDPYFTVVQGEANAQSLYNTLLDVFNSGKAYDAVVIIRGGGAQTDFLLFDQFIVGKIVAKFPIPVITGIGHQRNETITDMMAHSPVKTPTKAAELLIAHNRAYEEGVLFAQKAIIIKAQQLFTNYFQELAGIHSIVVNESRNLLSYHKDELVQWRQIAINKTKTILYFNKSGLQQLGNRVLSRPQILVANRQNDLGNLVNNFRSFAKKYFVNQQRYLGHYDSVVRMMSPLNILKKGFAIIYYEGKITANADNIKTGEDITIRLSGQELLANLKSKKDINGDEFNL